MVSSDEDEDTHYCMKCQRTMVGLERYVAHRKAKCKDVMDFEECANGSGLHGAALDGSSLHGAALDGSGLHGAGLDGSGLHGAALDGSGLHGAALDESGMHGAALDGRSLHGAALDGSGLHGAALDESGMHGAALDGSGLHGAALDGSGLHGAALDESGMHGAALDGSGLHGAALDESGLHGAALDGSGLHGAALDGRSLHGAALDGSGLHGAALDGSGLHGAALDGSSLHSAALDENRLHGAALDGGGLHRTALDGSDMHEAALDGSGLHEETLEGGSLHGAALDGSALDGGGLDGAERDMRADDFFWSLHLKSSWEPPREAQEKKTKKEDESDSEQEHRPWTPPPSGAKWTQGSRGKWGPGEVAGRLYWCGACSRRLSSGLLYERHLRSEYHLKRARRPPPPPQRPSHLRQAPPRTRPPAPTTSQKGGSMRKKKGQTACLTCDSLVRTQQMGKHLVSHYHASRLPSSGDRHPQVLQFIHSIVREAPFQCRMCKFYTNTVHAFIAHWTSEMHRTNDTKYKGKYWCCTCKYQAGSSVSMGCHLVGEAHREAVDLINCSVPVVVSKWRQLDCSGCGASFRYNRALRHHAARTGHLQQGTSSDSYQEWTRCESCGYCAHSLSSLQGHVRARHARAKVPYFCRPCGASFPGPAEARLHRKTRAHREALPRPRPCPHCPLLFGSLLLLKAHMAALHPGLAHRCLKCGEEFLVKQELSQHARRCRPPCGEACSLCGFASPSAAERLAHRLLHQSADVYSCPYCARSLRRPSLLNHLRIHTGERPFPCRYCSLSFRRSDVLARHVSTAHCAGPFECTTCRASLPTLAQLNKHKTLHAPREKFFTCSQCQQSFFHKGSLKQHAQVHAGRRFRCEAEGCVYTCRSRAELRVHAETHSELRAYSCGQCSYTAKTKGQLAKHIKSMHKEAKKLQCTQCSFTTKSSSHMKRHMLKHSGTKPFQCPHCNYRCTLIENLRKHVLTYKKHRGLSLYKCDREGCSFGCNYAKQMKSHVVSEHGVEPGPSSQGHKEDHEGAEELNNRENPTLASVALTPSKERQEDSRTEEEVEFMNLNQEDVEYDLDLTLLAGSRQLFSQPRWN